MTVLALFFPVHALRIHRKPFLKMMNNGKIPFRNSRMHHTSTPSVSRKMGNTFVRMMRETCEVFRE